MSQLLLLYSHEREPVSDAFLKASAIHADLVCLSLRDLLEKFTIFDEIDADSTKIQWESPRGVKISNTAETYLINRVIGLSNDLFDHFESEDKKYALSEFRAYLTFAIHSFPNCSDRPGPFGLSGNQYSLPRQWEIVQLASYKTLHTPEYILGVLDTPSNKDQHISKWVYTSPSNLYYWKVNEQKEDCKKHSFAFVRPLGIPLVCCVFGQEILLFPAQNKGRVNREMYHTLRPLALEIVELFKYSIAEILFFWHETCITFGMISNIPFASKRQNWFDNKVINLFSEQIV